MRNLAEVTPSISNTDNVDVVSSNDQDIVSQDVSNRALSSHPPVVKHYEHAPDKGSTLSQRGCVGGSLRRAVAVSPPSGRSSLPKMNFRRGPLGSIRRQARIFPAALSIHCVWSL